MKNCHHIAVKIIAEHTEAAMSSVKFEPKNNRELYEFMREECAFLLTQRLFDEELTPMEYNEVRNILADALWRIFKPFMDNDE